ncbi:MAG: FtsX-like permease family protein [Kofleriaceae bacterium]
MAVATGAGLALVAVVADLTASPALAAGRRIAGVALAALLPLAGVAVAGPSRARVWVRWGAYLLAALAAALVLADVLVGGGAVDATALARGADRWDLLSSAQGEQQLATLALLTSIGSGALVALGALIVLLVVSRIFSFYSTVSISGVWIGTMALVVVLSVMGGFEADLRVKILGSNAHIQITREDGEFSDWRAVREQVDAVAGVRASTPFATSEVVIASNSNYYTVIVKGIDTSSVAAVTDLVRDLDDPDAIGRLEPLIVDDRPLEVPQDAGGDDVDLPDPAPADLPDGADPIDFSSAAIVDARPADARGAAGDLPLDPPPLGSSIGPGRFGGDALTVLDLDAELARSLGQRVDAAPPAAVVDPAPDDFADLGLDPDQSPTDFSRPGAADVTRAVRTSATTQAASRRTQTLHGVLVGRELTKQIHLYTGQEVRLISPLSDPSNPDATGTPIPFNRDYRVAGVFYTGMYEYDLKFVYVTLASLQSFLDRGDVIDGIEVRIDDPDETAPVAAALSRALGPAYRVQDWRELNRNLFSALKLEKIAMFMVLAIIILVASFSIIGNLIMVVIEKGREIALLKTLGASHPDVVVIFILQGVMIGVSGTVLGLACGLGVCWYLATHGFPINPDVYYISKLPVHVDLSSVALVGAAGLVISIAATLYPAYLASRLRPAAGLRH